MAGQTYPVRNTPDTLVRSSHGIQIKIKGEVIGAIRNWSPAEYTRGMTRVWELNPLSSGHPIDQVPGNLDGFTLRVDRYDIWKEPFEKVFGGDIALMEAIGNQQAGFDCYQYLWHPDGYKELTVYRNSWFTSIGRNYSADGDRIIMVSATLAFLRRDKIL